MRLREASGKAARVSSGGAPARCTAAAENSSVGDRCITAWLEREEPEGDNRALFREF